MHQESNMTFGEVLKLLLSSKKRKEHSQMIINLEQKANDLHKRYHDVLGENLVADERYRKLKKQMNQLEQEYSELQWKADMATEQANELKQALISERSRQDVAYFLPHIPYLHGMQIRYGFFRDKLPGGSLYCELMWDAINNAQYYEVKRNIEACTEILFVQDSLTYRFNDEDRVWVWRKGSHFIAAVYTHLLQYQTAKSQLATSQHG